MMTYAGNTKFLSGIIPAGTNKLPARGDERSHVQPEQTKTLPSRTTAPIQTAPPAGEGVKDAPPPPTKKRKGKAG